MPVQPIQVKSFWGSVRLQIALSKKSQCTQSGAFIVSPDSEPPPTKGVWDNRRVIITNGLAQASNG